MGGLQPRQRCAQRQQGLNEGGLTGRLKSRSESRPRRQRGTLCLAPSMAAAGGGSLARACAGRCTFGRPGVDPPGLASLDSSFLLLFLGGFAASAPSGGVSALWTTAAQHRAQLQAVHSGIHLAYLFSREPTCRHNKDSALLRAHGKALY